MQQRQLPLIAAVSVLAVDDSGIESKPGVCWFLCWFLDLEQIS